MSFASSIVLRFTSAAVCLAAGSAAAEPVIYNLGTLGGIESYSLGVNDAGQVAGYSFTTTSLDSTYRAFRYDYDGRPIGGGVMIDLGTLDGTTSQGRAVNNVGQVAGNSQTFNNLAVRAFRYDGTPGHGVMHNLGILGASGSSSGFSFGYAINDAGQVAGYSSTDSGATHAFRHDGGGVMRDLGTLGGTNSEARGVNNAGQVAGYSQITGSIVYHAFRYDGTPGSGGIMRDLGTLGGTYSYGYALNDAGQVAGYSQITGDSALHAFRYDGTPGSGGVMRDLGTLGGTNSYGQAVNDAGQVAGYSQITGDTAERAFLYIGTPGVDGQMIDLDAWLDASNPAEGAKWTLTRAYGISDTGWITGIGEYNDGAGGLSDGTRAFLFDASSLIPEPSAIGILALGAALSLRRRRPVLIRRAHRPACG